MDQAMGVGAEVQDPDGEKAVTSKGGGMIGGYAYRRTIQLIKRITGTRMYG